MTRDEHLAEAEKYLEAAERVGALGGMEAATPYATIGLLHVALANAKPITVTPKPPVADTDWLKLEGR